jgi:DNA-binding NarL/FixJ family response regulator
MLLECGSPSVLIVDDHGGFRAWARAFFESQGYCVAGEASGGAEAVESARRLRPDVLLLDIHLPDFDGFEVARQLASTPHPPAVVLVSSRDVGEFGHRVADSHAHGFISKADLSAEALEAVLSGGT